MNTSKKNCITLFCAAFLFLAAWAPPGPIVSDTMYSIATAESIVHAQTLAILPTPEIPTPTHGNNNLHYSKYGIGYAISFIPQILIADLLHLFSHEPYDLIVKGVTSFTNTLYGSLVLVLLFIITTTLGCSARTALTTVILCATASILLPYSKIIHSEMPATLLLLIQILIMLKTERLDIQEGVVLGLCAGALVSIKTVDLVFAVPTIVHSIRAFSLKKVSLRGGLILAAIPTLTLSSLLCANYIRFGNLLESGYGAEVAFDNPLITGLTGFLFSPSKSIFIFSPLLIAALMSFPHILRSHRAVGISLLIVTSITLILFSLWHDWHGGWCWGPRFLVPVMIAMHIGIGPFLEKCTSSASRVAIVVLTAVAIPIQLCGTLVSYQKIHCFYYDPFSTTGSQIDVAARLLARKLHHDPEIFMPGDFNGAAGRAPEAIRLADGRLSLDHKETFRGLFTLWDSIAINRGWGLAAWIPLLLIFGSLLLTIRLYSVTSAPGHCGPRDTIRP